jgi:hypothetical protein
MTAREEFSEPLRRERPIGRDPVLDRALGQLRLASDRYEAQISLNIIKIIAEHQMEAERPPLSAHYRHWSNLHDTLQSALQLLADCPDDLQPRIIPTIAHMIERTLLETPE